MNITQETSAEALSNFNAQEKKDIHYKIILSALNYCPYPLTGYGISQRCKLTYHQVMRRMSQLERLNKVHQVDKKIDVDNAKRVAYEIIKIKA